jgi:Zn-dependent oligopeptidase
MNDLNKLVAAYVLLRDKKAQRKKAYEESVAAIDAALTRCEQEMHRIMAAQGAKSISTEAGTVYRATKTMCSVADWDAVLKFVQDNKMWHLLKKDIAKNAVEEYRTAHDDLPPGLNWREEITVGVRRA